MECPSWAFKIFCHTCATHTEKSIVAYLNVWMLLPIADTIMQIIHDLHTQFIDNTRVKWLLVEGDAKLYDILQSSKSEYGKE